jgi:hypothetical protein
MLTLKLGENNFKTYGDCRRDDPYGLNCPPSVIGPIYTREQA